MMTPAAHSPPPPPHDDVRGDDEYGAKINDEDEGGHLDDGPEHDLLSPLVSNGGVGGVGGAMRGGAGGGTRRRGGGGGGGTTTTPSLAGGGGGGGGRCDDTEKRRRSYSPRRRGAGGGYPTQQPLVSLTVGGYGPASPSYDDSSSSPSSRTAKKRDGKGRTIPSLAFHTVRSTVRFLGCSGHAMRSNEGPNGEYYRDDFNDQSWSCSFGTGEEHGVWMNTRDQAGTVMAFMVWFLLVYSALTITFLAETGGIPPGFAMAYCALCCLALACHAKTTFTDPGSVPQSAVPEESARRNHSAELFTPGGSKPLAMCSQCQTFKPPFSHHCRICNRCISRMDHHCPWMNNCIGAGNLKHFLLFLIYTWLCSAFSLLLLGWNYFFCADEDCTFASVLVQLARVMTCLSVGSFLFTSSMIMNVTYGLMTGIGTIDRLKKKATNTMLDSDERPIPLKDVFGIAGYHTWPFPVDPIFEDYDRAMGYSTPQRLLREQMRENPNAPTATTGTTTNGVGGASAAAAGGGPTTPAGEEDYSVVSRDLIPV